LHGCQLVVIPAGALQQQALVPAMHSFCCFVAPCCMTRAASLS
jgi:hypothetical protein